MAGSLSLTKPRRWPRRFRPLWSLRQRRSHKARQQWEAAACWFRLRYVDGARATKALQLLSQQGDRVALHFIVGELSQRSLTYLYVGVAPEQTERLQQMARDFGLMLESVATLPQRESAVDLMLPVTQIVWRQNGHLHLIAGQLFQSVPTLTSERDASYWPLPSVHTEASGQTKTTAQAEATAWCLPTPPPLGITSALSWSHDRVPTALTSAEFAAPAPLQWPLGWASNGQMLRQPGVVNLYGQSDSVAIWLVAQISQMLSEKQTRLIVLDGSGTVVPQLKRKSVVTRQLGKKITYLDIDGTLLTTGCNPLAPLPHEEDAALVARWQRWFAGTQSVETNALLQQAQQSGVGDLSGLNQWLIQQERQGKQAGIAALQRFIQRLTADRTLREWLLWPTNPFDQLPDGVLLFSCRIPAEDSAKEARWARIQLLRMLYLAACACTETQLVLHGLPWEMVAVCQSNHASLLISNGPPQPHATTVLTAAQPLGRKKLAQRFFADHALLAEQLALLRNRDALVSRNNTFYNTHWIREKRYPQAVDK